MSTEEPQPEAEAAPEPRPRRRGFRTGRLEAFSDGVFAIAITLLVLDLGVSSNAGRDLLHAIGSLWPASLAYVASFSTIGAAWLAHNAITEYLDRADAAFVRLNLLLLLFVSFLPFRSAPAKPGRALSAPGWTRTRGSSSTWWPRASTRCSGRPDFVPTIRGCTSP